MTDGAVRRYLAIVQFPASMSAADLAKRVPGIRGFITNLSTGEMEQFFHSVEGRTFGMFFKSAKPLPLIRSVLDGATSNGDTFMVLEVGPNATAKGFGRALTWLQHH